MGKLFTKLRHTAMVDLEEKVGLGFLWKASPAIIEYE